MRSFYASAVARLLAHFALDADVDISDGQQGWSLVVKVRGPRAAEALDVT